MFVLISGMSCQVAAQSVFDSVAATAKVTAHIGKVRKSAPALSSLNVVHRSIEYRVDYADPSFDFSRVKDSTFLTRMSRQVLVTRFADIKHKGSDVYVKVKDTRFPLNNLEILVDQQGNIVRDIPAQEIQRAMQLIDSSSLISIDKAKSICRKSADGGFDVAHARLLVDISASDIRWQLWGAPNTRSNQQAFFEVDAHSGRIIQQKVNQMTLSGSVIQR